MPKLDGPATAPRRRALLLSLGLTVLAGLGAPVATAQTFDLNVLMQRMAQRKSGEAAFTEERTVGGIDGPLFASGTLVFAAPDRFARHTLQPVRESMEVQGRTLILRRGGRTRQMDMDMLPEVGALLDAMRATLTGDVKLLQKHFKTVFSGNADKWVLRLLPLNSGLAQQVQQIELVGQSAELRSIELRMTGGDRSLMLIEALKPITPK